MLEGVKRERQGQDMKQKKKKNNHRLRSCLSILCAMVILCTTILNVPGIWASDVSGGEDIQNIFESDTSGNQESVSEPEPDEQGFSSGPDSNEPGSGEQDLNEQGISDQNTNEPQQTGGDNTAFSDDQNLPYSENEDIWRQSVSGASLTGDYARDLVAVAHTQLGVTENMTNVLDGCYYSRYGEWYNEGTTYNEWSAMFVSFCAQYANIPTIYLPKAQSVSQWAGTLGGMYGLVKEGYTPKAGDLIFFHTNEYADGNTQIQTGDPAHIGIVTSADDTYVYTIEGNSQAAVKTQWYPLADEKIYAYLDMDTVKKAAGLIQEEPQPEKVITSEQEGIQQEEIITSNPEEKEQQKEETENPEEKEQQKEETENPEEKEQQKEETENPEEEEKDIEDEENKDQEDATQKRYVEIISDEVNLRAAASDSEDSEIIDTVNTGTVLELTAEITNPDDNTLWYEVIYEREEMEPVTAYVRSDYAQIKETEKEGEEEITRYDYEGDGVQVKVTLTDSADLPDDAQLVVTPVEISQETEDKIAENAIAEQKAIKNIHAYDIKFLREGEEIQPGSTVKVEILFLNEEPAGDADVYHVDEEKVENMGGSVNADGNVEFETEHFSTYVIVNNKYGAQIHVKVEHYNKNNNQKIYTDDERTLNVGQEVDCKKATNWDISEVKVNKNDGNGDVTVPAEKILLAQDATVKVYYTPSTGIQVGAPVFYDYTVKAANDAEKVSSDYPSINQDDCYASGSNNNRITMGAMTHQYNGKYQYVWSKDGKQVNDWTGNSTVIKGLLGGINSDGSVRFNYPDPGLFTNTDKTVTINGEERYLRQVYKGYSIEFERNGDTYTLNQVKDSSGNVVTGQYNKETGNDFFPLDTVAKSYENSYTQKSDSNLTSDNKTHNYYFGMRYDIEFTLGDYIGDLNYSFTGDDDMWVVLDGGKEDSPGTVIIDLGGIHDAATETVDLWEKLYNGQFKNNRTGLSLEQKAEKHTLTVLYLERGAGLSNCKMNFTLPEITISQVTTGQLGKLTFHKVNAEGAGLSGATFALYMDENCTSQITTKISGENGTTTFDNLRPGTYYLKELQAPDGYVASNDKWMVEVYKNNETAVLKNTSGEQVQNILNERQQGIIESRMETNKTAEVKNWDQRTYDITIKANTITSSTVVTTSPVVDIMLVLDISGSMQDGKFVAYNTPKGRATLDTTKEYYIIYGNYKYTMKYSSGWYIYYSSEWYSADQFYNASIYESKLSMLKGNVAQFIKDTAAKSPNSKIGIVTFSSSGYNNHNMQQPLQTVGTNEDTLITFVNGLYAVGGTDPAVGLTYARSQLDTMTDGNSKYVILFTDGEPTGNRTDRQWDSDVVSSANTAASGLKQAGYTVYTIGFELGNDAKIFLAGGQVGGDTYSGIASAGCAREAGNAESLGEIFREIQQTITDKIEITGVTVTDVIDPRFEIVDNGQIITTENFQDGSYQLSNDGIVTFVNGNYQVQWTDQTIPNKDNGGEWKKVITVRAKDEYIGGNNIPTNISPDSFIHTGYGDVVLDQPKVNVKSDLVVNNYETTIFYGDSVQADETIIKKLLDKNAPQGYVTQLDGTQKLVTYTIAADGQSFNPDNFTFTWYENEACSQEISVDTIKSQTPEPGQKKYYLKVTYNALGNGTDESNANTSNNIAGEHDNPGIVVAHNAKDDTTRKYGVYTVNIISGQIKITKEIPESEKSDQVQTFTFNIKKIDATTGEPEKKEDGTDKIFATVNIEIPANGTYGTAYVQDENAKLQRGIYNISESESENYFLSNVKVNVTDTPDKDEKITDCWYDKQNSNSTATFALGYIGSTNAEDTEKTDVIGVINNYTGTDKSNIKFGGILGVVTFTNEKVTGSWGIRKVDSTEITKGLADAEFELSKTGEKTKTYYGKSSNNGLISWYETKGFTGNPVDPKNISPGEYELRETKAPVGYASSNLSWEIKIVKNGKLKYVKASDQDVTDYDTQTTDGQTVTIYYFRNQKLYSLPNSGGPGIYMFTISGVAFIATALLLFIRNKRKEEEAGIRL